MISSPITFEEPPFTESGSVNGGTILEQELFGQYAPTRTGKDTTNKRSILAAKSAPKIYSEEEYAPLLTSIQARKYKAAVTLKRYDIIKLLNEKIDKLLPSKEAPWSSNTD